MKSNKNYNEGFKQVKLRDATHKRVIALGKATEQIDDIIQKLVDVAAPIIAERRHKEMLTI